MQPLNKVLIVDDDILNLEILEEILTEFCNVKTAQSGYEAFEVLPSFMPDLILLDIMMPGMDGYEVCKKIRSEEKYNYIKIILVSGKAMLEERLEGYNAGADDYITKPFIDEELEAKVKVFLKLKRSEEVDRIKGDLLRVFSHETRTPLNGILLSAELLMDDEALSSESKEYVNVINESGKRLLEFVQKTTFLCDLKSGIELNLTNESLEMHIKNSLIKVDRHLKKKNITLSLNLESDILLNADWGMMVKVFVYILENAIKFSNNNSTVHFETTKEDNYCKILIKDNGKGIDPEWIDKIFNEFAIKDVMHHQKGLGLSLAISRNIVELHGGTIDVKSTKGSGATFIITIPV